MTGVEIRAGCRVSLLYDGKHDLQQVYCIEGRLLNALQHHRHQEQLEISRFVLELQRQDRQRHLLSKP
jgi:hypothetical protein